MKPGPFTITPEPPPECIEEIRGLLDWVSAVYETYNPEHLNMVINYVLYKHGQAPVILKHTIVEYDPEMAN